MAGYVPWHGKKRATLLRRERELRERIEAGDTEAAQLRAAEEFREAKIRHLRSEFSRLDKGDGTHAADLARLEGEVLAWSTREVGTIMEGFRRKLGMPSPADPLFRPPRPGQ